MHGELVVVDDVPGEFAERIIEVDAPGAANPNVLRYPFQHVRRPVWPLDPETTWEG